MEFLDRLRTAWANLHPLLRFIIATLVLGAALLLAYSPAKSVYHRWQDTKHLKSAKEALAASRFAEARDLSFQILSRNGSAFEPLPILLRSTTALKDPFGVQVAIALLQDPRTPEEDYLAAWIYLCEEGPSHFPLSGWPSLANPKKQSLDFQLPLIDRLLRDQMIPTAASIIASSPEPYPVEVHCRLLTMLARTATEEAFAEFHRSLAKHLRTEPDAWPRWLELIDELPQDELQRDIYDALPESANSSTELKPVDALRIVRCQMPVLQGDTEDLFQSTFQRFQTSEPVALARWCLKIGRPDDAAKLIELDGPATEPERYRLQIRILEATKQNEKLTEFLNAAPVEIPAWETRVQLASIARVKGDKDLAKQSIDEALKSATENPDPVALIELARDAQTRQLDDLALDAWTKALIRGTGPLPPSNSLAFVIRELSEQQREEELFAVLNSLLFIEMGNPVIRVQHLYLACLTGRAEPPAVAAELRPLQEQYPNLLALRCALAAAYLLSGDFEKADTLTNDPEINWFDTTPANLAIRGIILAKTHRIEEARIYFGDFPWKDLLPSEKRVFEGLVEGSLE